MTSVGWPPSPKTELSGSMVSLTPATPDDATDLFVALDDAQVWRHLTVARPADVAGMREQIAEACAVRFPWVVRLRSAYRGFPHGAVVGWSSYLEVSPHDARLEIGSTAYAEGVWRSAVNTEAKLLLLGHAFEDLEFTRVQLKTDVRNERSIAGIEGIGAFREGVLRRYQRRVDDSIRDTVVFSILAEEWPRIREHLRRRLHDHHVGTLSDS